MEKKLVVKVVNVEAKCPVYKVGQKIVLDEGYWVNLEESDDICMHSLASIMPYYVALIMVLALKVWGKEQYSRI